MLRTTAVTLSLILAAGAATAQTFSLDDNPDAPLTSAAFAGLFSAEDPFGLFLPPTVLGLIGPSPSLITATGLTFTDGDILTIGPAIGSPVLDVVRPRGTYLNALSADHERYNAEVSREMNIRFSVDRATTGVPGSPLAVEAGFDQQPADIYLSDRLFPNPGIFVGTLGAGPFAGVLPTAAPVFGGHMLEIDESMLLLTAGLGAGVFIPPMVAAPMIMPGTHDNVDAYNVLPERSLDVDGDLITDIDYFFSVPPAEAVLSGVSAAAILGVPKGFPGPVAGPWAPATFLGLDSLGAPPNPQLQRFDDVDGLVVWDIGEFNPGAVLRAEPGRDYAIFSLSERSASLDALRAAGLPVDGSTIFFTDFTGAFAVYLFGSQVGVADINSPANRVGNIDALEICAMVCDPCELADVNGDGVVTPADFSAWITAFNSGSIRADQNCDGLITPADFSAWIANFNACV
jgi:hypothetical protein